MSEVVVGSSQEGEDGGVGATQGSKEERGEKIKGRGKRKRRKGKEKE